MRATDVLGRVGGVSMLSILPENATRADGMMGTKVGESCLKTGCSKWRSQGLLTGLEKHSALSKTLNANFTNGANCANFYGFIRHIRSLAAFALKILEKISDFENALDCLKRFLDHPCPTR